MSKKFVISKKKINFFLVVLGYSVPTTANANVASAYLCHNITCTEISAELFSSFPVNILAKISFRVKHITAGLSCCSSNSYHQMQSENFQYIEVSAA